MLVSDETQLAHPARMREGESMSHRILTLATATLMVAGAALAQSKPSGPTGGGASKPPSSSSQATNKEPYQIEGAVYDQNDQGVRGATVTADRKTATTDGGGHYLIQGVSRTGASVGISVQKGGCKFNPERAIIHRPADNVRSVSYTFRGTCK
jgi:hypothetical protein